MQRRSFFCFILIFSLNSNAFSQQYSSSASGASAGSGIAASGASPRDFAKPMLPLKFSWSYDGSTTLPNGITLKVDGNHDNPTKDKIANAYLNAIRTSSPQFGIINMGKFRFKALPPITSGPVNVTGGHASVRNLD